MRKTSVYLTEGELAALRRVARLTGRSQSALIRDGVRRVTDGIKQPEPAHTPDPNDQKRPEWFTEREYAAISLSNARRTVPDVARELSTEEALAILKSVGEKLRFFSAPRPFR